MEVIIGDNLWLWVLFDTEMGQGIESCFKTVQEMEGEERPHCSCDATNVFQRWRFLNIVILVFDQ